ncbi:MAG TPA: electron transfer flavoprotein subunit alpha, partial [Ignavibacteria bacterium]
MIKQTNEVWVFIEQRVGNPADVSFELLSKGRKLADSMKGVLKAVVIGDGVREIAVETFRYGVDEVLLADHPDLKMYKTLPYSRILNNLIKSHTPRIVLFGATIIGRDL